MTRQDITTSHRAASRHTIATEAKYKRQDEERDVSSRLTPCSSMVEGCVVSSHITLCQVWLVWFGVVSSRLVAHCYEAWYAVRCCVIFASTRRMRYGVVSRLLPVVWYCHALCCATWWWWGSVVPCCLILSHITCCVPSPCVWLSLRLVSSPLLSSHIAGRAAETKSHRQSTKT